MLAHARYRSHHLCLRACGANRQTGDRTVIAVCRKQRRIARYRASVQCTVASSVCARLSSWWIPRVGDDGISVRRLVAGKKVLILWRLPQDSQYHVGTAKVCSTQGEGCTA